MGGHVNPIDATAQAGCDILRAATQREVAEEELRITGPYRLRSVGLLNDDTNPVGAVHLGLVQVLEATGPVEVREKDVLEGNFMDAGELRALAAEGGPFESWSSLLLPHLERHFLPSSVPSPAQRA